MESVLKHKITYAGPITFHAETFDSVAFISLGHADQYVGVDRLADAIGEALGMCEGHTRQVTITIEEQ